MPSKRCGTRCVPVLAVAIALSFSPQADAQTPPQPEPAGAETADPALAAALAADARPPSAAPANEAPQAAAPTDSVNPDVAVIADAGFAWFSEREPLQTGHHDFEHTGFALQQVELSLQHAVDPYFRLDVFVAFGHEGVELEEAYGTTLALPWRLQVRAGQMLTRFGRLNATHLHAWELLDQPFPLGRLFGGEGNRGVGLELSWLSPLPWPVELVGALTDAGSAISFQGERELRVDSPLDFQATLALKQFFELSADWSLALGLSSAHGPNATGRDHRTELYGADLYLKWRPIRYASYAAVALQVEAFWRRRQVPGDLLQDADGYAQLHVRFARRWSTAARYEYGSAIHDRAGDAVADDLDPEWLGERQRLAQSVTFHPSEFSRLRLQGALDLPAYRPEPGWALMLAGEVGIGAHGAHTF